MAKSTNHHTEYYPTLSLWLASGSVDGGANSSIPDIYREALLCSGVDLRHGQVICWAEKGDMAANSYHFWQPVEDSDEYVLSYNGCMILRAQTRGRGELYVSTDFGIWNGTQDNFERVE